MDVTFTRANLVDAGWEFEHVNDSKIIIVLLRHGTGTCLAGMRLLEIGNKLGLIDPPDTDEELSELCNFLQAHETKYTLH